MRALRIAGAHDKLCSNLEGIDPNADDARGYALRVLSAVIDHARHLSDIAPMPRPAQKAIIDLARALNALDSGKIVPILQATSPGRKAHGLETTERRELVRVCLDYIEAKAEQRDAEDAIAALLHLMGHESGADEYERIRSLMLTDIGKKRAYIPKDAASARTVATDAELAHGARDLAAMYATSKSAKPPK